MALVPFANRLGGILPESKQLLIPPGSSDPRITPRVGILHTDGGNSPSLYRYFNGPSGGIESHLHIPKIGQTEQYRDTNFEADANYLANPFAISVETQGTGYEEWNDHQISEIKRIILWAWEEHRIPLQKATEWNGTGWGYHIQFGSPGKWTNRSKICPGPLRIAQFHDILVPWMKTNPHEEDEVTPEDRKLLQDTLAEVKELRERFENFAKFERERDGATRERDLKRYRVLKAMLGAPDTPA